MVRTPFKLPDIGEGVAEAEIVSWHVAVGDHVEEDAPLCDMMTDKATVEMTAPISGTVVEVAGAVGDQIAIGSVLAVFETAGATEEPAVEPLATRDPGLEATQTEAGVVADEATVDTPAAPDRGEAEDRGWGEAASAQPPFPGGSRSPAVDGTRLDPGARRGTDGEGASRKVLASPAVRARAKDLGIDLAQVHAPDGRVRHADLDAFLGYHGPRGYLPTGPAARPDEQVRVVGLRRRIAENMVAAKRAIPHFTYVDEIDVTKLEALREDLNATRGDKPRLTLLPLLITALCKALPGFPMLNARYDDAAGIVTRSGAVHLGIATQTDAGLMVPVVRDAQALNLWQLAAEIRRLAEAARGGKARSEELSGSTITLTSLGPLGGIVTTPVINRPEVAIVGPNKVVERPVVRDGAIAIAKVMNLSISCDHRVVDGHDAASFVQAVRRYLETPALLFVS